MKGGPHNQNQDHLSYTLLASGWMFGLVCDGHGEDGDAISERVTRLLPLLWSRHLELGESPAEALRRSFIDAQSDLEKNYCASQIYSGCTAAAFCLHIESSDVWVATVGDSRMVIGDLYDGSVAFRTDEHKAHDPVESERLKAAGAQVIQKNYPDGDIVSRIFIPKTGVPGLAMSRSFGDGCLKPYGVTAEPEIHEVTNFWQDCRAPVVVLASDGIWDVFLVEELMLALTARFRKGLDIQLSVKAVSRRAQKRWIEAEGDYCDDITIMLMMKESSLNVAKANQ
jgi:serine/threonine protein phosphatase PrpC